ncbi:MAG: hypothetical protein H6672_03085 [Anaerolineaceae bacterium]|nr:hypothetical protein [Anaerolineaceae bacterium]
MNTTLLFQLSHLIEERIGLAASDHLRASLEAALPGLVQGAPEAYLRRLQATPETTPEWQTLVDAVAIGETYFFRNQAHFQLLAGQLLPELIRERRESGQYTLNIWSAGCATGQEPYSLAMILHDLLPDLSRWTLNLIGTDINAAALDAARQGLYRNWSFRHSDERVRERYFTSTPEGFQLHPEIRERAVFRQANLLAGAPLPQMDIIFCRNVLLYFDETHVQQAEALLRSALRPGGWLFLGEAEVIRFERERWITHVFPGTVVYQRPVQPVADPFTIHTAPAAPHAPATKPPSIPPLAGYADAVAALRAKHYDEVECILAQLVEQQPRNAAVHLLLAAVFANRQALPEAHAHLDTALRLDALLADAHYLRALLFLEANQEVAAQGELNATLYCQRGHPLAASVLGYLYAKTGKSDRARRILETARQVLAGQSADALVSDISDLTASSILSLIEDQLQHLDTSA